MNLEKVKTLLCDRLGQGAVIENADMKEYTTFRAGGKAALLVIPQNMEELRYTLYMLGRIGAPDGSCPGAEFAEAHAGEQEASLVCGGSCTGCGEPVDYMLLGNGSNVLIRDGGYDGVIVKLGEGFTSIQTDGECITAGAGALLSTVAKTALKESLTGLEFASGIPGSVGGACFMNAGAYGGEMKDVLTQVRTLSKDGTVERLVEAGELDLGYRSSALMRSGDIVVSATFRLAQGKAADIESAMKDFAQRRNEKQPISLPSAGSFFKRPEGHFAGALIEGAGLKGLSVGAAQVSPLHAGFIVNNGGATAEEIEALMRLVQNTVMNESGVWLEPEVRIIGKRNNE